MGLFRKGGGGFLNGVDAKITGYQFSDEFNGKPFDPKAKKADGKSVFHTLYVSLSSRVDGAAEDQTTTLFAGGFDDYEVSADGLTITPNREGGQLAGNTSFGIFVESLVAAAAAAELDLESRLTPYNFEGMIGARVRFVQEVDEAATIKLGKVKDKKTGKPTYDRKNLIVEKVYELAPVGKASAAKPAAKGAKVAAVDVETLTADTLVAILKTEGGSIAKNKLSIRVIKALPNHAQQGDVRKMIQTDELLTQELGWSYDATTGLIEAA